MSSSLTSSVLIVIALNVILFNVFSDLYFNNLQRNHAAVFQSVLNPDGEMLGEKYFVLNAAGTIFILGLFAIFLASEKRRALFQWLLFLVGARFLILYFQVIGNLAMTGIGLIISGLVVIGITVIWNKHRKTLAEKAEGWLQ